jgi:DNA invertase Pin-like site-specific DNA recombinase
MICAIYARKSTEQNDVGSEEKSVTRQIQHGKAYAEQKGWTAPTEYVFSDDGISGVNFVSRPGFIRLMNSLKPKPPFNVLVMSEESRLGRESIETAYALKQITDAGVRVFFYLEDRERKLDSAMDKVMLSLATFGAEVEREKCRQRTHDAMRRKAERKEVIGCPVYGYDVVAEPINYENANRPRMLRRINPAESKVVLRLFAQYSTGTIGFVSLAKQLNAEGIPPPRGHKMGMGPYLHSSNFTARAVSWRLGME